MNCIIEYMYACHRGILRAQNQDNYFCDGLYLHPDDEKEHIFSEGHTGPERTHLFAVFDGLGGEQCGETAACLAAETLDGWPTDQRENSLAEACLESNRRIAQYAETHRLNTCGTTAAMLLFDAAGIAWCNIGDSRICRIRGTEIEQISKDDLFPAWRGRKPPLFQYLGIPEEKLRIEPHTGALPAVPGDIYLICTDGLTDMIPEKDLRDLIPGRPVAEAGRILLRRALEAGGKDNITFFLICLKQDSGRND